MSLLQAAYRTYETQEHLAGAVATHGEPLTPVSHMIQNAQIELTISDDGLFQSARPVAKEENKTIIPVTIESANRTGDNTKAHPLCDQLRYLAAYGGDKFSVYLAQLETWAKSLHTHPKVQAVLRYIRSGTILRDLVTSGTIVLGEDGRPGDSRIEGSEYGKCLIRWRVIPAPTGFSSASWEDPTLFASFTAFYAEQCATADRDLCFISGQEDMLCEMHPKGVVSANFGAKLISANDSSGFTYRGRFRTARQAGSVGYSASQKAHNALRWVAANYGITLGGRTFLCWNPDGFSVPSFDFLGLPSDGEVRDFPSYRQALLDALSGYRHQLPSEAGVVVAALDAATTGRLSITYYNELRGSYFLSRLEQWYATLCCDSRFYGVYAPSFKWIVNCAFGTQREHSIQADERVLREHIQRLLHCMVDAQPIPQDIVRALVARAGTPLAYDPKNREFLLATTCAVVRKFLNDRANKEEWILALDTLNTDRSYLFGRLLAVAEHAERSTYTREEGRETNAVRMQSVFAQRPLYAWRIIREQLNPYLAKMNPGLRQYFKNMMDEIVDLLPGKDSPDLGKKLGDPYLLGYSEQRMALLRGKQKTSVMEESEYGQSEK